MTPSDQQVQAAIDLQKKDILRMISYHMKMNQMKQSPILRLFDCELFDVL